MLRQALDEAIVKAALIDDPEKRMDALIASAFGSILTLAEQLDTLKAELVDKGINVDRDR